MAITSLLLLMLFVSFFTVDILTQSACHDRPFDVVDWKSGEEGRGDMVAALIEELNTTTPKRNQVRQMLGDPEPHNIHPDWDRWWVGPCIYFCSQDMCHLNVKYASDETVEKAWVSGTY